MKKVICILFIFILAFTSACSQTENGEVELISFIGNDTGVMNEVLRAQPYKGEFNAEFSVNGESISADGLEYSFSNGTVTESGISSDGDLLLTFKGLEVSEFNKFRLYYISDKALKCTVRYTVDGSDIEDVIFLEEGTNVFACLILGFLDNKTATEVTDITVNACDGESFAFALYKLETEKCDIPSKSYKKDYIIENDRYELGIRLIWGGGISYLVDKQDNISELGNLVNQADTGRLIQQAYYGTYDNERYHNAKFNNAAWFYNPVQGGDQYLNCSRLIDFVTTEHSVYVKSQPQDWALNGMITSSYMENVYTLYESCIRVENRFVDFTGWSHPVSFQELPAFYTLSYFETFAFYDGTDAWTNDSLRILPDLPWCVNNEAECAFTLKEGNTESWFAWVNQSDNYGIGLYTPNVSQLSAGRFIYDGSADPKSASTNYGAPVNYLQIVSYEPIEYQYLITTGSLDRIREIFTANKDFTDNSSFKK
ncbi:MAG: hypothetical protein E7481_06190 [Ruminococcaceae bacterium]|nr:hypothetical protein [Oscillospiraceae bacterium]